MAAIRRAVSGAEAARESRTLPARRGASSQPCLPRQQPVLPRVLLLGIMDTDGSLEQRFHAGAPLTV